MDNRPLLKKSKTMKINHHNKIIIAYGNHFESVKKYTNKNGWCRLDHLQFPSIEKEFNKHKIYWWRPKQLIGFIGD